MSYTARIVSGSNWWTYHSSCVRKLSAKSSGSTSNNVRFAHHMTTLLRFWPVLKRRGPTPSRKLHHTKIIVQNILHTLTRYANSIVNRVLSITTWWKWSLFSSMVVVARRLDIAFPSRPLLPCLNSAASSFTVEKAGA